MKIDEARRNRQSVGANHALRRPVDTPGFDDAAILRRDIAEIGRHAAAVVNPPAFDKQVISHRVSSSLS